MVTLLRETIYRNLTHRNFRRVEECDTLIEWLAPAPGERILDIGCGDGFYDHRIASAGAYVAGIDVHQRRLAIARSRNQTERTTYHDMDASHLTFPDLSFDKAVSFCVVEHLPDDERVFREVNRVLKPGGAFILSADSLSNPAVRPEEREAHRRRYAVNTFYTVDNATEKLTRAGFIVEETRYILTHPLSLALARVTWKLDDVPDRLGAVRDTALYLIDVVGKIVTDMAERLAAPKTSGLTLLISARKSQRIASS
jgi:SAM-dependent methyltransferase